MPTPIIVAIDEGTTNAKAVCIDRDGQIIAKGSRPLSLTHPRAAWSEQDPLVIIQAVKEAITEALAGVADAEIAGVAISNQRESVLIWDRATGEPLSPVVTWQCRRSDAFCRRLAASDNALTVQAKTGLPVDPLFPAAKIKWLLDEIPNARSKADDGSLCVGTIDTWLVWHLTGQQAFVTDYSNASRTQLFDIYQEQWDNDLLALFDIPASCLATVCQSSGLRGVTRGFGALPDGVPVLSQIGDSHAALYGQGGFVPGVIKATYGTGSSLMTPVTTVESDDYRLARTVAWHDDALTYALEGNITHTGAGMSFMSKMLGINDMDKLVAMAESTESNDGVYFVPALSGLGAPYWNSEARGLITGLTDNATPAILARAALESVAYQVADVFYLMESLSGSKLEALLVDGGATRCRWLMQFQADLLNRPVLRCKTAEVSALGAGYLAGKALGWWATRQDLAALSRQVEVIEPGSPRVDLSESYAGWKQAIERTLLTPTAE
ncbi:FGGY family carbohydrate kinase [Pokkaliibacter sp. CJK22405]|uniref:FGGY family carbohydrate kinase n=1 Tax=Pokkaliibacter sp. CJK22405 TaxID=3384615 RepID=UPI0039849F08